MIERECYRIPAGGGRNPCPPALELQALNLLQTGRARVQTVMSNLSSLAEQLAPLRGPKQVVILSSGLPYLLAVPVGDVGVQRAMRKLYGLRKHPSPARMTALARPWRPYRSIACWYLWRSLDD